MSVGMPQGTEILLSTLRPTPNSVLILRDDCAPQDRQLWLVIQMMEKGSCLHVMTQSKRMGKGEGLKEDWIAYILKETLQGQTLTLSVLQQLRTIISYLHGHTHVCPFCYGGTGRDWGVGRKESGGRD